MLHRKRLPPRYRLPLLIATAAAGALLAPHPAGAQTAMTVEAGLDGAYRSRHWLPVRIRLTHQGAPVRAEVRARLTAIGMGAAQVHRVPETRLQSGASELHTLYVRAPLTFAAAPLTVDLFRDGRLLNTVRPTLRMVEEGGRLVAGIGPPAVTAGLNLLAGTPRAAGRAGSRGGTTSVSLLEPAAAPARWQGLQAADVVVLAGPGEREFTPEQLAALRDYVTAGGTLLVTGGVNWNRLTTPFFAELLPARVTGPATSRGAAGSAGPAGLPSGSAFPICAAVPRPGAAVTLAADGAPLVVSARRGAGRVLFTAFDPLQPPFRDWPGSRGLWTRLMEGGSRSELYAHILAPDDGTAGMGGFPGPSAYGAARAPQLADAPYAIPQLDIPSFYVVALFLAAYIVVLVPLNYLFLKARDRKEYAWLTTPAIVVVFSLGAYMIGYSFKGARTLVVKVGVVEAWAGEAAAPAVAFAGLFSPRKAAYDLDLAGAGNGDAAPDALFFDPDPERSALGMRVAHGETQKVEAFAVEMWAMRAAGLEGMVRLGRGVGSRLRSDGARVSGTVTNGTPYTLEECHLVAGGRRALVGTLAPGARARVDAALAGTGPAALLPASLLETAAGGGTDARMKRSILEPLCTTPTGGGGKSLRLVGWVREPVLPLRVNGARAREVARTLLVVHLEEDAPAPREGG